MIPKESVHWLVTPAAVQLDGQMKLTLHRGNIYKPDAETLAHLQELEAEVLRQVREARRRRSAAAE